MRDVLILFGGTDVVRSWYGPVVNHGTKRLPTPTDKGLVGTGHDDTFGGVLRDTWVFDDTGWRQATATGPRGRAYAAMAYHPGSAATVLFGGADSTETVLSDAWAFTDSGWRRLRGRAPSARARAAMVPLAGDGLLLFGGHGETGLLGDTWLFDGARWAHVDDAGPSPRLLPAAAFDPRRHEVVLFGGYDGAIRGDTWAWSPAAGWTQRSEAGPRDAAVGGAMAFDALSGQIVLFGGETRVMGGLTSAGWRWDGTAWYPAGVAVGPDARRGSAATSYGSHGSVLFGGDHLGYAADTWVLGA